ncbi:hypothetical protein Bbelb_333130, partial [Branchiostoma belcheri]
TSSRIGQAGVSAGHDLALAAAAESDSSPSDTYKRWLNGRWLHCRPSRWSSKNWWEALRREPFVVDPTLPESHTSITLAKLPHLSLGVGVLVVVLEFVLEHCENTEQLHACYTMRQTSDSHLGVVVITGELTLYSAHTPGYRIPGASHSMCDQLAS